MKLYLIPSLDTSQDSARSPSILMLSWGPVNIKSVEYCGATGCTMAKVVVAWQSVVGGSATTPKLRTPPRLGVCARAAGLRGLSAAAHNRHAAFVNVTDVLLSSSFSWPAKANMRADERTIAAAGQEYAMKISAIRTHYVRIPFDMGAAKQEFAGLRFPSMDHLLV